MTYSMDIINGGKKNDGAKAGQIALGIGIGALLGLGIGILIAPKSGKELREDIRNKAVNTAENMKIEFRKQAEAVKDSAKNVMDKMGNAANETQNSTGAGKTKNKRFIDLRNKSYEFGQEYGANTNQNSNGSRLKSGSQSSALSGSASGQNYKSGSYSGGKSGGSQTSQNSFEFGVDKSSLCDNQVNIGKNSQDKDNLTKIKYNGSTKDSGKKEWD